jgi:hypothetical protein
VHSKYEIEQLGEKKGQNHNGSQQFPNGWAKIITGGTQEVSQKVVSDENPPPQVVLVLSVVSQASAARLIQIKGARECWLVRNTRARVGFVDGSIKVHKKY